jgi:hypothetical protein
MPGQAAHFNLGFSHYTDEALDAKINLIRENMTDNANYTNTGTKVTDLTDEQATYSVIKGKKGTALNFEELRKDGRVALIDVLVVLGEYARDKYPGDVTIWKTTGFTIQEFNTVSQEPNSPTGAKGKDGKNFNTVLIRYKAAEFATGYEGRVWKKGTPTPDGITMSKKGLKMLFINLEQGIPYNFQIRSVGTKGISDWGTIVVWVPRTDPNA